MTVKLDSSLSGETNMLTGLSELSSVQFTKNEISDMILKSGHDESKTSVLIRSNPKSVSYRGEIERTYTRINIEDLLLDKTDDKRIHIWGNAAGDNADDGWSKRRALVLESFRNLRISVSDKEIEKIEMIDGKHFVFINSLSIYGKCEIHFVGTYQRDQLSSLLRTDNSTTFYTGVIQVPLDKPTSTEQFLHTLGTKGSLSWNTPKLDGCTLLHDSVSASGVYYTRVTVPINHPLYMPGYIIISYKRISLPERVKYIYSGKPSTPEPIPFFYPVPLSDIKSEDFDGIRVALNEQFKLNLAPDEPFNLSGKNISNSTVNLSLNTERNFTFNNESVKLLWSIPKQDLDEVVPKGELDMYTGIK